MLHHLMEIKITNLQTAELKDTPKSKWKNMKPVHFAEITIAELQIGGVICRIPTCLYARSLSNCVLVSHIWARARAPGYSKLPLDSIGGPKHIPEVFY